ncbi:hypothetical protein H4S06_000840 [Coemansia sp. BCRC 34490]|nr:hypothetical protein H4S06_000840 [Coemansia sp. BCRC 34490]
MFRPKRPFFRTPAHKRTVLSAYRGLLRQAKSYGGDAVEKTYLRSWIRERFHHHKHLTSPGAVDQRLSDAAWASLVISEATTEAGTEETGPRRLISDLAYARRGWLKDVADQIGRYAHPTKPCALVRDTRPRSAQLRQPHPAYRVPVDPRAIAVPGRVVQQLREADEARKRLRAEQRARRERRRAREIEAMAESVDGGGNRLARGSGLLGDAFAYHPHALHGRNYVAGVVGNPAWVPPRIRQPPPRGDPPVVQHVRSSIGYEFLRINTRKPPHWLGAKIAAQYRAVIRRLHKHEFYFYMAQDLALEEDFERRLGISDPGYARYARNYREYLRQRIRTFTVVSGEGVQDPELLRELAEGSREYQEMVGALFADDGPPWPGASSSSSGGGGGGGQGR